MRVGVFCGLEASTESQRIVAASSLGGDSYGFLQNMHEFFHNLSCPLAGRRGRAYLLHVLSAAHKTPGTQFVTARMALTRGVGF